MHIQKIVIENYKSFFEETKFEFQPGFNVLLGANSSGKTSVLQAIELSQIINTPHRSILNIVEPDTKWAETSRVEVTIAITRQELQKELVPVKHVAISIGESHESFYTQDIDVLAEKLTSTPLVLKFKHHLGNGISGRVEFSDGNSMWRPFGGGMSFPHAMLDIVNVQFEEPVSSARASDDLSILWGSVATRTYRFSAERRVEPTSGHHGDARLLPNSANLAYCLNWLQTNNDNLFAQLNALIHRVFPTIHWIAAPPNGNTLFEIRVHTVPRKENRGDLAVPINQVGTGVFNALAMLYVTLTAQTQQFILLEEPNSFLHPRALRELLAILSEVGGHHQFFITTHSSDVLRTINASTITLLKYDGRHTTVEQTSGATLGEFRSGLLDLGIRLTDLHGCDRVLWVEGETEESIFPLILKHFYPSEAEGIAVLPLHATGDFESRRVKPKKVAEIYRKLSQGSFLAPPMVAIALDREKKSKSEIDQIEKDCVDIVYFLKRPMLEDYLLDADAIAHVINKCFDKKIVAEQVAEALKKAESDAANLLFPEREGDLTLHASKTLNSVFQTLGEAGTSYHKTAHGPLLADWLLKNKPHEFRELQDWLRGILATGT